MTTIRPSVTELLVEELADRILGVADSGMTLTPLSDRPGGLALDDGYRIAVRVMERRIALGERPVGWKVGFTNPAIQEEHGIEGPIWGPIYDDTVLPVLAPGEEAVCDVSTFAEPRIEPEIVFRMRRTPEAGMSGSDLLHCVDAVGQGVEIVQSLYPGWRFKAADTVAAFSLHGCLFHGPLVPIRDTAPSNPGDGPEEHVWAEMLESFTVRLKRDGALVDEGTALNILGGPLQALADLVQGLPDSPFARTVDAGDLVTTGALTRAFPVDSDESWSATVEGLPVPGMTVVFR